MGQICVLWIDTNITRLLYGLCGQREFDPNMMILTPTHKNYVGFAGYFKIF